MIDEIMKLALDLAEKGKALVQPNPMVGAIIVHDREIVGEGFHERSGGDHAEVRAIAAAGERSKGSTMFVTLEPCCIFGKTPPCTDAIIEAGISRVICPDTDPNPRVNGKGLAILRDKGIAVEVGLLQEESRKLNEVYYKYMHTGSPFVTLKMAQSLDGCITTPSDLKWVTGELARRLVHEMRACNRAVMVGIGTVIADDPLLDVRYGAHAALCRQPLRVIVDTDLRVDLDTVLVRTAVKLPTAVYTGQGSDKQKEEELEKRAVRVTRTPAGPDGRLDLKWILEDLGKRGISSVMVEGGRGLATELLNRNLTDKVVLFNAPRIFGEGGGTKGFGTIDTDGTKRGFDLSRISVDTIGSDVIITGYPLQAGD